MLPFNIAKKNSHVKNKKLKENYLILATFYFRWRWIYTVNNVNISSDLAADFKGWQLLVCYFETGK